MRSVVAARALFLGGLLALLGAGADAATDANEKVSFQALEESLTCQCGCGLTVHSCNHLQCPSAIPLRQEIRAQMSLGLDQEGVLGHFEQTYGEKILSSPTTRGFNLAAWVMPFFMVAAGSLFVMFTLLRWRRAPRASDPTSPQTDAVRDDKTKGLEEVLERELKEFDG
jgi:cytochrome c-type biogenesis protein CcmH